MTTAPTLAIEPPEDTSPSGVSGVRGASDGSARPVWALSGEQMLTELDALHIEACRVETRRLALLAALDKIGHAKDIGARSTADLIARRHRLDYHQVYRDLKLAKALPKYPVVQQGLDNGPRTTTPDSTTPDSTTPDSTDTGTEAPADESTPDESTGAATSDAGGEVSRLGLHPAQAEAIVTSLERVPDTVPVESIGVAEQAMVVAARVNTPSDLRKLGREALERLDPDGREPNEDTARDKETLSLGRAYRGLGVQFRGFLANENAELFQALIDACSKPRKIITETHPEGILDPRTKTQRQADALIQILHTAATTSYLHNNSNDSSGTSGDDGRGNGDTSHGNGANGRSGTARAGADDAGGSARDAESGGGSSPGRDEGSSAGRDDGRGGSGDGPMVGIPAHGGIRPHIMVTINLNDLIETGRQHTGDLLFGDRLSASAVRRLACDAQIIPIVLGTNAQPLDVGQDFRSVTPAIRMALIARDKGCVVCGAPPGHCDAHHIEHWADGGATSVNNTALGCKPCHRDIHKGIFRVTVVDGVVHVTGPHYQPRKPEPRTQPAPPERTPP